MKKELAEEMDITVLNSGSLSSNAAMWGNLFREGKLTESVLTEYWYDEIPEKCSLQSDNILRTFDSLGPAEALVNELEEFMYDGQKDAVNDHIKRTEKMPTICAKALENGEPSYNCRECSTDTTCVMCVNCFQRSPHRFHKYRMGTSAGGGFCDCGDPEAWKCYPYCDFHVPKEVEDLPLSTLPADLYQRCKFVFSVVLEFSCEVINKQFCADMRSKVDAINGSPEKYMVVMYNDEVHTFDQVITLLVDIIKCTPREGLEFASKINREGRAAIMASDFRSCCKIKYDIERISSQDGKRNLEVRVLPTCVVFYQYFALHILNWVQNFLSVSVGFRSALVEVLLDSRPVEKYKPILLQRILLQEPELWKSATLRWNMLICSGMLVEYEYKKVLAIHYIKTFNGILTNYINEEEDHNFSVALISVQLFTVPSIAHSLIAFQGALKVVVDFMMTVCSREPNSQGNFEFKHTVPYHAFVRATFVLHDARYLLSSPPLAWSESLCEGFLAGVSSYINLLCYIEGMDSVTRQLGSHIEFEPEWETSFKLLMKLFPVTSLLYEWCASNKSVLVSVYKIVLEKWKASGDRSTVAEVTTKWFGVFQAKCMPFNAVHDPVSVHLPLTRFWGGLHRYLEKFELKFDSEEFNFEEKQSPLQLVDQVLRTRAMVSQFRAGMWRKNGHSLASQIFFYHNTKFRLNMLDMDLLVLQIGASLLESNAFLINVLYKFGILDWDVDILSSEMPETEPSQLRIVVEEFLHLIIVVTTERFQVGVANVSEDDCIRYEITHMLTLKSMPYSVLIKAVSSKLKHELDLQNILGEVALFKTADITSEEGQYELKVDYPPNFNVFFYHFSKEESVNSEQLQKVRHKKIHDLECCPPPVLPAFSKSFAKITDLLKSDVLMHVITIVLNSHVKSTENVDYEGQLHKVLFLIGIALREEEATKGQFGFCDRVKEWKVDKLLLNVYCGSRPTDHRDLTKWVLQKYINLRQDASIEEAMRNYENMNNDNENGGKPSKSILGERARANIMAKMKSMQQQFVRKNAESLGLNTSQTPQSPVVNTVTTAESTSHCSEPISMETLQSVTCILCQEDELVRIDSRAMVLIANAQHSTVLLRRRNVGYCAVDESENVCLTSSLGPAPYVSSCGHVMHADCWDAWRLETLQRRVSGGHTVPESLDTDRKEFHCPLCQFISNTVLLMLPSNSLYNDDENQSSNLSFTQWLKIVQSVLHIKNHALPKPVKLDPPTVAPSTSAQGESCTSSEPMIPAVPQIQAYTFCLYDRDGNTLGSNACSKHAVQQSTSNTNEDTVGYKICSGEDWVLNIKTYTEESLVNELSPNYKKLPTDKMNWINALSTLVYATNTRKNPFVTTKRNPTHLWKSVAYTIHTIECNLRYESKPLLGAFTVREESCLENLIRIAYTLGECDTQILIPNQCALKYLSLVVENTQGEPSVLDWDCFGLLLVLLVSIPSIVHESQPNHVSTSMAKSILRLMLVSQIAQILITMDLDSIDISTDQRKSDETECLLFLTGLIRHHYSTYNTDVIWEFVKESLRPFLRCCVILHHFHFSRQETNGLDQRGNDTFENLCCYLRLPTSCRELLGDEVTQSLFVTWASHPTVNDFRGRQDHPLCKMITINELVPLPQDYSELLNKVGLYSCPSSYMETPTMCLICGTILCSLSYCCQKVLDNLRAGACTYHAHECGGGIGLFLRIRDCQLMLLAGYGKGCWKVPPYLDEHDEPDQGLRRGNQLRLCEKRYRKLQLLWLSHGIPEEVSRAMDMGGLNLTRWQFF